MCRRGFEYAEHTADILIIAYGENLEEAFKNAALGFANIIYNVDKVELKERINIEISGNDLEELLFTWIDELLYLFDGKKFAFGNYFENLTISKVNERYFLKTLIGGEKYSIDKHGFKGVVVKAMTYHMMSIEKIDNLWKLQYVVDI